MPFSSSYLYAGLVRAAEYFRTVMFTKIDQNNLPSKIKDATTIDSPKMSEAESHIDVVIDTSEKAAPMAGAFEWGSGIHGKGGGTYPIPREGNTLMVFPANKWPNKLYNDDPVHITHAMHPGVAARPYIAPSIVEAAPEIRKILAAEFKAMILADTQKIVIIE